MAGSAQGRVVGLDGSDTTEEMPGSPHQEDSQGFRGCGHKELWKHFLLHSEPQPVPKLSAGFNNALNSPPLRS